MIFNQYSFLYVEDDSASRDIMHILMTSVLDVGRYYEFSDSTNFLERLTHLPNIPDVFLLDIHMKPASGFDILRMIRTQQHLTCKTVIALTASVMNEEIQQLRHAGFNGAIAKPINLTTFPDALERILKGQSVWHIA
ncbi:MAG: response regulator [Pleurocapsa minor GSE-CHR-MK-17-07R]|jgi:two-component system cell cycle response regulator DivK|nr:response regulator [Pleurocapsa minor GSE-CHR-MK 17-07R]